MRSTLDGIATRRLNACNLFLRAAVTLACLSVVKVAVADANTTGSVAEHTDVPEYGFIEQRIYRGESAEAQQQLEGIIEQLSELQALQKKLAARMSELDAQLHDQQQQGEETNH